MSEIPHTPGPWYVVDHSWSETSVYGADPEERICFLSIKDEATEENQQVLEQKMGANARLIAAAPELLEALEELLQCNVEHNEAVALVCGTPPGWKNEYLDKARAAIAKAKGGADE